MSQCEDVGCTNQATLLCINYCCDDCAPDYEAVCGECAKKLHELFTFLTFVALEVERK